jgi:sugar phosphate isomerase/epimerase
MPTQIAAQLYTLRDYCKTPADIAKSMKKVADIGYRAVQASALGPIEAKELRKILDDNGLVCCATHKPLEKLRDETQKQLDDHAALGCKYTAIGGYFPKAEEFTRENWDKFISDFNSVVEKLKGSPLRFGYHNHSHEFAKIGNVTAYQYLFDKLSPGAWIEVDTYWVQHGGGDPALWIEKAAGRLPCVHLKDLGMKTDRTHLMLPVGEGNLNWDRILQACKNARVEWYIVEQDNCNGEDPFDCLKRSLEFVKSKGLS